MLAKVPKLACIDIFFHNIRGNGGARGASHIVIFLNPSAPKSDLNQISHCNIKGLSVREVIRVENMIT